jgi:hypothetical protein
MYMYKNWINGILGLVVVGVSFMNVSSTTLTWTLVVVGAIIALNSLWGAVTSQDDRSHTFQSRV